MISNPFYRVATLDELWACLGEWTRRTIRNTCSAPISTNCPSRKVDGTRAGDVGLARDRNHVFWVVKEGKTSPKKDSSNVDVIGDIATFEFDN
jgi:hypothetical protein